VYAVCSLATSSAGAEEAGLIRLFQSPGQPVQTKVTLQGLAPEAEYQFRVRKFGVLGQDCRSSGAEFNPLQELDKYN